jgi:hypothetical protein
MRRFSIIAVVGLTLAGCGDHHRTVVVPRINSAHLNTALTRLHRDGLRATFGGAQMPCGDMGLPKVNHQEPRAGTRVPPGAAVSFKLGGELIPSGGGGRKTLVPVPNLVGQDEKEIALRMVHVPLWVCVHVLGATDLDAARVVPVRQRPGPGTLLPWNGVHRDHGFHPSTVTLYYAPPTRSSAISNRRLLAIAQQAAARNGDRFPSLIQHSALTTRRRANLVDSGDVVPYGEPSYLIAIRGHFKGDAPRPPGSKAPSGTVLTLVVNALTGKVTDGGLGDNYPDLAKFGPVHIDLQTIPPGSHKHFTPGALRAGTIIRCVHGVGAKLPAPGRRVSGFIDGSPSSRIPRGSMSIRIQTHKDGSVDVLCG